MALTGQAQRRKGEASSSSPTLIVVSGPPGAGKTTLAHEIARAVGCPAVCRDESFLAGGVTTVAELALDVPEIDDTTSGYRPGLEEIVAFVSAP